MIRTPHSHQVLLNQSQPSHTPKPPSVTRQTLHTYFTQPQTSTETYSPTESAPLSPPPLPPSPSKAHIPPERSWTYRRDTRLKKTPVAFTLRHRSPPVSTPLQQPPFIKLTTHSTLPTSHQTSKSTSTPSHIPLPVITTPPVRHTNPYIKKWDQFLSTILTLLAQLQAPSLESNLRQHFQQHQVPSLTPSHLFL